jgi:hypothetical protein
MYTLTNLYFLVVLPLTLILLEIKKKSYLYEIAKYILHRCILLYNSQSLIKDWCGNKIKGQQIDSVRFCIEQGVKNSAYIHHLNIVLYKLGYCSTITPKLIVKSEAKIDKRLDPTLTRYNYRLTTHSFTSLLWIYNSFYYEVNGIMTKKKIPD